MKLYLKLLMFTFIIADACANVNQIFVKPMRPQIKYTKDSGDLPVFRS